MSKSARHPNPDSELGADIGEEILALLRARDAPMTIIEIVGAIAGSERAAIWLTCAHLRNQGRVIRDGLGTTADPYRFRVLSEGES